MASLIDALPGQTLPIAEVNKALADLTQGKQIEGDTPTEFRASQMNLILHFGKNVTPEQAQTHFDTAINFAQQYPCRVIILCPEFDAKAEAKPLEAKLYNQCFLGPELRNMCCVEALMLAYHTGTSDFLENQVSVWLENDLPVYYWFTGMSTRRVRERFMPFLKHCRRVVYDSSFEADDYSTLDWPEGTRGSDLAHARILPLRQGLGQFLSAFSPAEISDGLERVNMRYCAKLSGEAKCLQQWFNTCMSHCTQGDTTPPECSLEEADCEALSLEITCTYSGNTGKHFCWRLNSAQEQASLAYNLGHGEFEQTMRIKLLHPQRALSEAFFFG